MTALRKTIFAAALLGWLWHYYELLELRLEHSRAVGPYQRHILARRPRRPSIWRYRAHAAEMARAFGDQPAPSQDQENSPT